MLHGDIAKVRSITRKRTRKIEERIDQLFATTLPDEEKLKCSAGIYKDLLFYNRRLAEARGVGKPKCRLRIITRLSFVWIKDDMRVPVAIPIHVSDEELFNHFNNMVNTMTYEGFTMDEASQKRFDKIVRAKMEKAQNPTEDPCDTLPISCKLF